MIFVPPSRPSCRCRCYERRHRSAAAPPLCRRQAAPAKLPPPSCRRCRITAKLPPPSRCAPPPLCRHHCSAADAALSPPRCRRRRAAAKLPRPSCRRRCTERRHRAAAAAAPPPSCRREAAAAALAHWAVILSLSRELPTAQRSNIGGTLQVGTLKYRMREYRPNIALNLLKNRSYLRRFKAIFGRYLIVRYLGDPAIQNIDQKISPQYILQQDGPVSSNTTANITIGRLAK